MIVKKNIHKIYFLFLFFHLIMWTLIPTLTNVNLPLDTIEALAWGSNIDWGFNKHPPFSAIAANFFYIIFGNQDWAYYLLSQIFIILGFIAVFKLANDFFKNDHLAFLSVILLEGIFFFNYTSPEFNVNVSQLPFWGLSIFFTWRVIKYNKYLDSLFLGLFLALGLLSKYLFIYLIFGIYFLFIFLLIKGKIKFYKILIVSILTFIIFSPHLIWLFNNDFTTITYGLQRTGIEKGLLNHFISPIVFILKQVGILSPFLLMIFFLLKKIKFRKIKLNDELIFLLFTFLVPIVLMILTSLVTGAKIRTMWMTPFYLFIGVFFIYIFKENIILKNLNRFYLIFLFLFFFSPITYAVVSLTNDFKRTDYPGKEIARLVQERWDQNFSNDIKLVIGDEWYAGNLSYHLNSRPRWVIELKESPEDLNISEGIIYTGNPQILKNICPGVFGTIKPVGYCMIGRR